MDHLTALIIQTRGDDIRCLAGGPDKDGKYAGWISLYRGDEYDHDLLSTNPCFQDEASAIKHMQSLVEEIRTMDIENPLDDLPTPEKEMIQTVVEIARMR
ncbi:MAG: hypothetical protein CEN88_256 [Candidatus Berkelbacteria bacterium Licking1014_2]|uniref:Uncharacterized protein n=1 Tax=Candidatus Berkelbacteria bacterium Licking1014_2 TaxID=2017146 RepID=A0A554LVN8_9BACT|nr:MAG: hypothetical protein CEN88_256 [Candidatus Berkelbacteria bacterium Licking1014_2]